MMNKLITSLVLAFSIVVVQLPMSSTVEAADDQKKDKRKTQLASPSVGKKVVRAFDAYTEDDIDGALVILKDISTSKAFDKAYVTRFIAVMYAQKGDEVQSIKYLKEAIEPDILNAREQGEAIKLLADLQMQTKDFTGALANYQKWMDFTGEEDANTYVKITQAYYESGILDKMIEPANKAIVLYGDKQNQNPYILKVTSYYERKMYNEAVGVLETVVQIYPDKKQWWTQLGMFYLLVEDYTKGVQTLDLAYKQGFLEKESQIKTLASLYSQSEAPYKAATLLEKNIASGIVKRDDKNLSIIANAWHAAQHIDKAAKYYGELAKMTGEARHYRKQGMLLKQDEQFSAAIVAFDKSLELGVKGSGKIYQSIAESYFYLGKYKNAYAAIKKAMKDPKARRGARGWVNFIKDTAQRKKIAI